MISMGNPWIDPRVKLVRPHQARAYMLAHAWKPRQFPRPQIELFEGPLDDAGEAIPLCVPLVETADDYVDGVVHLVTGLAQIEDRYAGDILSDILAAAPASAPSASAVNGTPRRSRGSTRKKAAG